MRQEAATRMRPRRNRIFFIGALLDGDEVLQLPSSLGSLYDLDTEAVLSCGGEDEDTTLGFGEDVVDIIETLRLGILELHVVKR